MKNLIDKSKLSNINNPHYFIFKSEGFNIITKDSVIIDFKSFPSAKEANKYAKSIGAFSAFATFLNYDIVFNK